MKSSTELRNFLVNFHSLRHSKSTMSPWPYSDDPSITANCRICEAAVSRKSRPDAFERFMIWFSGMKMVRCHHCNRRYYLMKNNRLIFALSQRGLASGSHSKSRSRAREQRETQAPASER